MHAEVNWLEREDKIIEGLDPLGIEVVSINLYSALLPGITNVTDRARYYSFYPWVLHRFAQNSSIPHTSLGWCQWLRQLDFAYAVASVAYQLSNDIQDNSAAGVVGSNRAHALLKQVRQSDERVDIQSSTQLNTAGKVPTGGAYFKNPEGGFGQYYKVPLEMLGMLVRDEDHSPGYQLTCYAGLRVAQSVDQPSAFRDLIDLSASPYARFSELAALGAQLNPSAIQPKSEEEQLLRRLFLGNDDELCQGQDQGQRAWRRNSLLLALRFINDRDALRWDTFVPEFRWACTSWTLSSGIPWHVPDAMRDVATAWAMYHRNDLLNYALECLFWVALHRMDEGNFTPRDIAHSLTGLACAAIPQTKDHPDLPALAGSVSAWMQACALPRSKAESAGEKPRATRSWAEYLEEAVKAGDMPATAGWAIRLLGRLASDHGTFVSHPFEVMPQAAKLIASPGTLHLGTWLRRGAERASESLTTFLEELTLEWILYRHLRVATRKLANQGDFDL